MCPLPENQPFSLQNASVITANVIYVKIYVSTWSRYSICDTKANWSLFSCFVIFLMSRGLRGNSRVNDELRYTKSLLDGNSKMFLDIYV